MNRASKNNLRHLLEVEVYAESKNIQNPIKRYLYRFLLRHMKPETRIIYLTRKMMYHFACRGLFHRSMALYLHRKIWNESSCYISPMAIIEEGLKIPHPVGIVIGGASKLGKNVTIYQGVTIGSRHRGDYKQGKQPTLGNNVVCFSHAQILGDITIGNDTIIGASAVVLNDIPNDSISIGIPAKVLKTYQE